MKIWFSFIYVFFLMSKFSLLFGQDGSSVRKDLETLLSKQAGMNKVLSQAIAVVRKDSEALNLFTGFENHEKKIPLTGLSIFNIASLTKPFVALAIAKLISEGKLQWTTRIVEVLPDFALSDLGVSKSLTLEDLLSHRTGLATFEGDLLWLYSDRSDLEIFSLLPKIPLSRKPRYEVGYSNLMYIVLGLVIEKVTRAKWSSYLKEKILLPLGMKNTSVSLPESPRSDVVTPYYNNLPVKQYVWKSATAAAGLYSCLADLVIWANHWLDLEKMAAALLIPVESLQRFFKPFVYKRNAGILPARGISWEVDESQGSQLIEQEGSMPPFESLMTLVPEHGTALIVLNSTGQRGTLPALRSVFLRSIPPGNADKKLEIFKHSELVGLYQDDIYGGADVYRQKGEIYLRLNSSQSVFSGKLEALGKNRFAYRLNSHELQRLVVTFALDSEARTYFVIGNGPSDFNFASMKFLKQK